MIKMSGLISLLVFSITAGAIVDMKSANYSESWTDLTVPGVGYDLRVNRTYNSRSLFNGLFGFGWCSDYETKIDITTESNLRLTECGAGMEMIYTPKNFKTGRIDATVGQIISEIKKKRPDLKPDYIASLQKELKVNDYMREEFGRQMNIRGKPEDGTLYLANGREAESIVLKGGTYRRTLADGTYQLFDSAGRLTQMSDKNQNYLKLVWDKENLVSVSDNLGRKIGFKYNPLTKKVSEVVGPNNMASRYEVKGEDLIAVTDATGDKFRYTYDEVHNLTRIDLSDGTYKTLAYNKDKDWVVSFRNRKGCLETYDYQVSKTDPKNHYWSNVIKKCNDKVTNTSKYEFIHKLKSDGTGVYLQRVHTEINKSVTDIVYHEVFNKPLSIVRDNERTEYTYYDNGLVRTKREVARLLSFEYKNSCNKVSQVVMQYFDGDTRKPSQAADKPIKTVKTKFIYEAQKCNLIAAEHSDGQLVKLQYDPQGRISKIEDQAAKTVTIKYEGRFGKPSTVTRLGLGTINVTYKPDGEIAKVESKEGSTVAVQVASIFNSLLDIIAPATNETPL